MTKGVDIVERFEDADSELAGRRLLILGGGLWQLEYVRRARQLGLETWVTDWSATAVARDEADHFEPIDLKDRDATLTLARRARIDAVLTAADIGVPTAAYLAERLGLAGHRPKLASYATNKFEMRQRSRLLGIAGPWYRRVRSPEEAAAAIDSQALPAIVKPVDNCSSRSVRWIDRQSDLVPAVAEALAASPSSASVTRRSLRCPTATIWSFGIRERTTRRSGAISKGSRSGSPMDSMSQMASSTSNFSSPTTPERCT